VGSGRRLSYGQPGAHLFTRPSDAERRRDVCAFMMEVRAFWTLVRTDPRRRELSQQPWSLDADQLGYTNGGERGA
jgi:hypothetical protein